MGFFIGWSGYSMMGKEQAGRFELCGGFMVIFGWVIEWSWWGDI